MRTIRLSSHRLTYFMIIGQQNRSFDSSRNKSRHYVNLKFASLHFIRNTNFQLSDLQGIGVGVVSAAHNYEGLFEFGKGISLWDYDNSSSCLFFLQGDFKVTHVCPGLSMLQCHDNRVLTCRFAQFLTLILILLLYNEVFLTFFERVIFKISPILVQK